MSFWLVVGGIVFICGLVQWARSGALLWDFHRLLKHDQSPDDAAAAEKSADEKRRARENLQSTIRNMEMTMDGLLRSSFKILGVLALCVWVFVMVSVVADMLGLDWVDRLSFSVNRLMGDPMARSVRNVNRAATGGATSVPRNRPSRRDNVRNFRF